MSFHEQFPIREAFANARRMVANAVSIYLACLLDNEAWTTSSEHLLLLAVGKLSDLYGRDLFCPGSTQSRGRAVGGSKL